MMNKAGQKQSSQQPRGRGRGGGNAPTGAALGKSNMVFTAVEVVHHRLSAQQRRRSAARSGKKGEGHQGGRKATHGPLNGRDSSSAQDVVQARGSGLGASDAKAPAAKKNDDEQVDRVQVSDLGKKDQGSRLYDLTKFKKRKISQQPKMPLFQQYLGNDLQPDGLGSEQHPRIKPSQPQSQSQSLIKIGQQNQDLQERLKNTKNIKQEAAQVFSAANIMAASQAVQGSRPKGAAAATAQYQHTDGARGESCHSIVAGSCSINSRNGAGPGGAQKEGADKRSTDSMLAGPNRGRVLRTECGPSIAAVRASPRKLTVKSESPIIEDASQAIVSQADSAQHPQQEQHSIESSRLHLLEQQNEESSINHILLQGNQMFRVTGSGRILPQDGKPARYSRHRKLSNAVSPLDDVVVDQRSYDRGCEELADNQGRVIVRSTATKQQSAIRKKNNQYYTEKQGTRSKTKEQYLATSPQILQSDLVFLGDSSFKDPRLAASHNFHEPIGMDRSTDQALNRPRTNAKQVFSHQQSINHQNRQKADAPDQFLNVGQHFASESSHGDWLDLRKEEQLHREANDYSNNSGASQRKPKLAAKNTEHAYQAASQPSPEHKTIPKIARKDSLNNEGNLSVHKSVALTKQHSQTSNRNLESNAMLVNISQHSNLSKNNSLEGISYGQLGAIGNNIKASLLQEGPDEGPAPPRIDGLVAGAEPQLIWNAAEESIQKASAESQESLSIGGSPGKAHGNENIFTNTTTVQIDDKSDELELQENGNPQLSSLGAHVIQRRPDDGHRGSNGHRAGELRNETKVGKQIADSASSQFIVVSDVRNPNHARDEISEEQRPFALEDREESQEIAQLYHDTLLNKFIDQEVSLLNRLKQSQIRTIGSQHNHNDTVTSAQYPHQYGSQHITIKGHKQSSMSNFHKREALMPGHGGAQRQKNLPNYENSVKMFKKIINQQNLGQSGQVHQANNNLKPIVSLNSRKRGQKESRSQTAIARSQQNFNHSSGRHAQNGNTPSGKKVENENHEGGPWRAQGRMHGHEKARAAGGGGHGAPPSHNHQHHHYHIDLNIQQVNNILINYGIMPMSQERPPATAGPSCQTSSGRGPNAYNLSRSQVFGSKSNLRQKEPTMTRTNGKSQPKYQRNQAAQQAQSQPLDVSTTNAHAANMVQSPERRISEQHFQSQKKYKKDSQQSAMKLQNKMKSRHDKLQSQVQSLTQSKNQLMNHHAFHKQDLEAQGTGASHELQPANKVFVHYNHDAGYNPNVYINVTDASTTKSLQHHKSRLIQAFDKFDTNANVAPPDLRLLQSTTMHPQLRAAAPMVVTKNAINFASADQNNFTQQLRQPNTLNQEEVYSDDARAEFLRRTTNESPMHFNNTEGDLVRLKSRKIFVRSEQKEDNFKLIMNNQADDQPRVHQYQSANYYDGRAAGRQERLAVPRQQAERLHPPYQFLIQDLPSRNDSAAEALDSTATEDVPLLQIVGDASAADPASQEAFQTRKPSKGKLRKERLSNGSASNQSKAAKSVSNKKPTVDKLKVQASYESSAIVIQDKMKSLTVGRKQLHRDSSALKKRRESNKVKGERLKRGGNLSNLYMEDGGSPTNAENQRGSNSEFKNRNEAALKIQDAGNEPASAGLPQSIDLQLKRGAANHSNANLKQLRQHLQSRDRNLANVLKNQEYKIRQIDKQSKRANILMEQFNEGGLGSTVQRMVSQASDQFLAAQNANKARPPNEQGLGAISSKEMKLPGGILGPKPQISDFKIYEQIGVGNFGRVCKAYNNKWKRTSALKIIKKESIIAMKQVEHVIGEREVLKHLTLQHGAHDKGGASSNNKASAANFAKHPGSRACPFIIKIFSSFQDEEHLYLELEYVEGCTLLSQISKRNHEVTSNMPFYAAEALLTLEFLHNQNIIYRDLKPENIVLSMRERGHMKLVDFGFARQLKHCRQKCMTNCGTPQYIAPEIIRGAGHSHEVDIWSLGVLIADVLSGQTPFQAENTKLTYEKILLCQPTYARQIGQTQRDLLNKIFVSDPSMRITLQDIKKHSVFKDFDWDRTMMDHFLNEVAPFIPESALFNEIALRTSSGHQGPKGNRPKNTLAAMLNTNAAEAGPQRQLSFDHEHFQQFLKQDKRDKLMDGRKLAVGPQRDDLSPKRKRQNPLGDFKFKKIDEYF